MVAIFGLIDDARERTGNAMNSGDIFNREGVFSGIPAEERAAILKRGRRHECSPGAIVFREGEPALRCYFVQSDRLKLSKLHEGGRETIVRYINPGEIAAAVAVFRGKTYPATAESVGSADMVSWDRSTMLDLLAVHPHLASNLLRVVVDRLDDIQNRYLELQAEQVDRRVARALLRIMVQAGRKTDEGIVIDFRLSRQELADYTGTTLFTVSRLLSAWEKKGWILSGRERITISDPHALVLFSER
ncbi:MAG: Crp/Fnr family transcriptional regulator [Thermodesulfobacteriota bacterium]